MTGTPSPSPGADWDSILGMVDLTGVDFGADSAREVIAAILDDVPNQQVAVAAARLREAATTAKNDRELLLNVVEAVTKVVDFAT